jgi:phage-related protein
MRNYFIFGNIDSRDCGVYISRNGVYNAPEREYNVVSVPGRNGDLIIDSGRYKNITLTYKAFIVSDFAQNIGALRSVLLSQNGYKRLEDSYNPDEFRQAYFQGGINVSPRKQGDAGEFDLSFICKPQRFLKSGDEEIEITIEGSVQNPTPFPAKPLITVNGNGTLYWGDEEIVVESGFDSITIDSELCDCYHNSQNANDLVTFSSGNFPLLQPGLTEIGWEGDDMTIIPRYFNL